MLRIGLIYGAIAGTIVIGVIIIGALAAGESGGHGGELLGYLVMIVALSMIILAIKRHRDRDLGGVIRFLPAFLLGLLVSAVAWVFYVIGWEGYLAATDHAFIDNYVESAIEAKKAAGLTGAELDKSVAGLEKIRDQYGDPLYRLPMTFLEIFPVGLLIALLSAAVLRNPKVLPARAAPGAH